jgi:hypothetical protein
MLPVLETEAKMHPVSIITTLQRRDEHHTPSKVKVEICLWMKYKTLYYVIFLLMKLYNLFNLYKPNYKIILFSLLRCKLFAFLL